MIRLCFVICVVVCVHGGVITDNVVEKPEKLKDTEGCYVPELDDVIPYGSSRPSNKECVEIHCHEDMVTMTSCGVLLAPAPPLELVEDKDKPYPDCCPRLKDNDITNE